MVHISHYQYLTVHCRLWREITICRGTVADRAPLARTQCEHKRPEITVRCASKVLAKKGAPHHGYRRQPRASSRDRDLFGPYDMNQ